ncbi:hypothetical protein ACR820_03725 [Streptomyces netropsis]
MDGLGLIMCSDQGRTNQAETEETSELQQYDGREAFTALSRFRGAFYDCLTARQNALFEE